MKRAFTLIELLVVVAIIGILAGILLPVLARARERGQQARCSNNLKQIWTAIRLYQDDYDTKFPEAWRVDRVVKEGRSPSLHDALVPYVMSNGIWACPSDWGETFWAHPVVGYTHRTPPFFTNAALSSYEYRGLGLAPCPLAGLSDSYVRHPALMPVVWEARPWHDKPPAAENAILSNHRMLIAFVDGHVEQGTRSDLDPLAVAAVAP